MFYSLKCKKEIDKLGNGLYKVDFCGHIRIKSDDEWT